jgi:hypothetical protein
LSRHRDWLQDLDLSPLTIMKSSNVLFESYELGLVKRTHPSLQSHSFASTC